MQSLSQKKQSFQTINAQLGYTDKSLKTVKDVGGCFPTTIEIVFVIDGGRKDEKSEKYLKKNEIKNEIAHQKTKV